MSWFGRLFGPDPEEAKLLAKYNSHAFKSTKEEKDKDLYICVRLAEELKSAGGKKAIALAKPSPYGGFPIHEINKNGTFSLRPPYFVSRYTKNWHLSGARHMIQTLISRTNMGFKTSDKEPGVIKEIGVAILEYNTYKFSPINLSDLRQMLRHAQKNEELKRLLVARLNGEKYIYQGSPYNFEFMVGAW